MFKSIIHELISTDEPSLVMKLIQDSKKELMYSSMMLDMYECNRCGLRSNCKQHVPGKGSKNAHLMFIGEGPGAIEDEQGKPFVGPAGKVLDKFLELAEISHKDIYITNIIKCRPQNNRTPNIKEVTTCEPYLKQEIDIVDPKIIVCLGSPASNAVIHSKFKITEEHGKWFEIDKRKIISMYHPAYILHTYSKDQEKANILKDEFWNDLKKVKEELNKCVDKKH